MRGAGPILLPALLVLAPLGASAAFVEVSFVNDTRITDSNVAGAIGAQDGNFDSGDGRVGIESGLASSLSSANLFNVGDVATGEVGLQWGIEADHCLGAGGCGGGDHFVAADGILTVVVHVEEGVSVWALELDVQSYGNLNGVVDGGTLPACTSVMSADALAVSTGGEPGISAVLSGGSGLASNSDSGDCTQDGDWFKNEAATLTVSGTRVGTFEIQLIQRARVESEVQTGLFSVKNGSDTCFRAGRDPGDGISFYDACDYPGLADADGDRDGDGLLGNEPNDGGIWVTDRLDGSAVELTQLAFGVPAAPPLARLLGMLVVAAAAGWALRRARG